MDDKKRKVEKICNEEPYVIPNEAACSPEFSEGCKVEDNVDKDSDLK